jgi:hypothetical protein
MKGKIFASFLTVSILFGLIIVSIQFVNAGNVRTISIDGNIADWAGISPSATADDSAVDSRNYQAIYLANDQNNLYLRFDTVPFADFHNVTFGIDTDLNWNTLNPISGQNGSAPNELFLLYHSHYGDAAMVAYANFMWQFCSYSPIENNWLCLASDANQNGIQFACSDGEIEIAIPLSSLGIRNPLNQIWIAFPFT